MHHPIFLSLYSWFPWTCQYSKLVSIMFHSWDIGILSFESVKNSWKLQTSILKMTETCSANHKESEFYQSNWLCKCLWHLLHQIQYMIFHSGYINRTAHQSWDNQINEKIISTIYMKSTGSINIVWSCQGDLWGTIYFFWTNCLFLWILKHNLSPQFTICIKSLALIVTLYMFEFQWRKSIMNYNKYFKWSKLLHAEKLTLRESSLWGKFIDITMSCNKFKQSEWNLSWNNTSECAMPCMVCHTVQ